MEEQETVETTEVKQVSHEGEIRVSSKLLYSMFGMIALAILIICKICASFGVGNLTFYGIMSIFIYVLPFLGVLFTYVSSFS